MEMYLVGGAVRDQLMGIPSNDLDYVVVIPEAVGQPIEIGFAQMKSELLAQGYKIFLENPDMVTIRAKSPNGNTHDYVLARKETKYSNDSRRPIVVVGTLEDDIFRRDFTVNALAMKSDGTIIDLVGGVNDIEQRILRAPINAETSFRDDPLRALRAVRFYITKGFNLDADIMEQLFNPLLINWTRAKVSQERSREELQKMFKYDSYKTMQTLLLLDEGLVKTWFGDAWLMPTFKK